MCPMCGVAVWRMLAAPRIRANEENSMPLIQVKLIEGVFTASQKQEIVQRLTDAMVDIEGENLRQYTWCMVEEVASGEWGFGGQTPTADDVKALARGEVAAADTPALGSHSARPATPCKPLLNLAAVLGGNAPDGIAENVVVNGTNGDDNVNVIGNGSGADVTGLATAVSVTHADSTDTLSVNTLTGAGNVLVNGVAGAAGAGRRGTRLASSELAGPG